MYCVPLTKLFYKNTCDFCIHQKQIKSDELSKYIKMKKITFWKDKIHIKYKYWGIKKY